MSKHVRHTPLLKSLSKRQWAKVAAAIAAVGFIGAAGVVSRNFYQNDAPKSFSDVTAFSATDSAASRSAARGAIDSADKNTTFVTVKINGDSRTVLGEKQDMTTVKDVLETGNITLEPDDAVSPSLKTKVTEATVITIDRAGADVETNETAIAFNEVRKETSSLPKGQEKVETEGENGIMETTSLVTRAGGKIVSSNVFASWVKKAPVDKVILVGTGSSSITVAANDLGTTTPAGEIQSWAHDYLLANGYTEEDFTAANYIISHESGWSPTATNPSSGAYGLAQAYPGSKMASAGADWQTNYQTQFKWFIDYCNQRYGGITAAYNHWITYNNY
ncbi:G5 domain-containing protein [Bifidobacterium miconisargentati]|uniref:aggregation-promoting factor C-terminal-like domain-containing protein n=1 Tax=Bifidobacterium miconisargentati TaxID=2834437 RepID=UPI001BDD6B04|nr:G5 domain-containing protein [Bifidobacterium miconisargentati]MBW3090938.1 G5 domain-containing protein [Bifidobacterium miconisargentati]